MNNNFSSKRNKIIYIFFSNKQLSTCLSYEYNCFSMMDACFRLISNMQILKTLENRIPIQMFQNWHNVSYHYVSCTKSETSDIWRTGAWFPKPFGQTVKENHIYNLAKPNSIVKTRKVYKGVPHTLPSYFGKWKNWLWEQNLKL